MKNTSRLILVLLSAAMIFALVSCSGGKADTGNCTIVIGSDPEVIYTVDLAKVSGNDGLFAVLRYLEQEKGLSLQATDSGYGAYLTEVGTLKQNESTGVYIGIWTNVTKDFDVTQYRSTQEWNGTVLTSAGVGASAMTIEDGAIIYIGTVSYS